MLAVKLLELLAVASVAGAEHPILKPELAVVLSAVAVVAVFALAACSVAN